MEAAQHFMGHREEEADRSLRLLYRHLENQPRMEPPTDDSLQSLLEILDDVAQTRPLVERVHDALRLTLPGHDEFWVHWTLVYRPGRRPVGGGDATR